jgi:hypothetical protein
MGEVSPLRGEVPRETWGVLDAERVRVEMMRLLDRAVPVGAQGHLCAPRCVPVCAACVGGACRD